VSLTEEQRRAVGARGSVAVVAGAGTGKTHMLSERYIHHLAEDGFSPLEVVAVAFTERAAGELRSRIRERVLERLPEREDVAAELEAAQISTIHALCARVCREHPDEAGVPADFGILDGLRGKLWTADRLADAMDKLPAEHYVAVPYPLLREVLESLLADPIAAGQALGKGPEEWSALVAEAREVALSELLEKPEFKAGRTTLARCEGASGDLMEETRRVALSAIEDLEAGVEVAHRIEALAGVKVNRGKKGNWEGDELERVKETIKTVRGLAQDAQKRGIVSLEIGPADRRLSEVLPVLREAFGMAQKFILAAKKRARVLDFADLEVHALRALSYEQVRGYYRERWYAFLIDEFQDTNPVQAEILDRLTEGTKLTVVGDEKQSIYGFRRADVEVFKRFRERILSEGGDEVVLATSFRAHRDLIEVMNAVFASVLGELRQDLEAHRDLPPHEGPHVRAFAVEAEGKVNMDYLRRAEAKHIAGLISEMLDGGVGVYDPSSETERPLRPGDVGVLSRAWAPLEIYGEALAAAEIPSVHAGGGELLETREAKDGAVMLRFLADPDEDLALVAVLRSPFFAVDDRLLHELAQGREDKASWWRLVREVSDPGLDSAREVLEGLVSKRRIEAPSALLELADRFTGYTAVIANLPGAARREADWRGFLELIRGLERGNEDVFTVVRWLRQLREAEAEVPRPPLEPGNAVSLMTIHSAKGLEWPVVVLPDLARGIPTSFGGVVFDPDLGVAVDFGKEDGGEPALYRLITDKKVLSQQDEARRVFYVAPTRARDHLVLSSTSGYTERFCGLTVLQPGLEQAGVDFAPVPFHPEDARPPELPSPSPAVPPHLLLEPVG
jgi:ATP-dependent helicase/nuclease subunit A